MASPNNPFWIRTPPSRFDIVATWYPERDSAKPGPRLRPSLVLSVLQEEETSEFACEVAFGTKVLKLMQREHLDLIIQNAAHLRQIGLFRATRFDLDLVLILPWTQDFFSCWDGFQTPVVGTLTTDYIKDYAYLMMRRQSIARDD